MNERAAPRLVIYGDFNCPFSALASARATRLASSGAVEIDWRAVEHDPSIPATGEPLTDDQRAQFARELDQVRGLLVDGEPDELRLPDRRVNTRSVTLAYAAAHPAERPALRAKVFAAYWQHGHDLNAPGVAASLGVTGADELTAARWDREWQALPKPIVPEMVLPDGSVERGIHALEYLATLQRRPEAFHGPS